MKSFLLPFILPFMDAAPKYPMQAVIVPTPHMVTPAIIALSFSEPAATANGINDAPITPRPVHATAL